MARRPPDPRHPILKFKPEDGLVLSVDGRASGKGEMGVEVLAELRDFAARPASRRGARSDRVRPPLVQGGVVRQGRGRRRHPRDRVRRDPVGFIETIKDLIPFDGFSDPAVPRGRLRRAESGFTLALPSLSIGVFTLSNMSLAADVQVPFLGKTRRSDSTSARASVRSRLPSSFIGGGGWFLASRLARQAEVLELGLEAGAVVASTSASHLDRSRR